MFRILNYAKKRWHLILLILLLLIGQAYCELTLPQYTSNIVDVGIQYKGIEHSIPEAIRPQTLQQIALFMSKKDKKLVMDAYQMKKKGTNASLQKEYPLLKKQNLYVLDYDKLGEEKAEKISDIMLDAQISMLQTMAKQAQTSGQKMNSSYAKMLSGISKKDMDHLKDTMGKSIAIAFVQQEYQAIGVNLDDHQMNYLKKSGIYMVGISFITMVLAALVTFVASKMAAATSKELRDQIFKKVISFSNEEMNQFSTASLITRCTNDVQQIQMVMVVLFRMVLYAPIIGIGGIIKVLNTNTSMVWIIALAVVVLIGIVILLMTIAMPKFKIMQDSCYPCI